MNRIKAVLQKCWQYEIVHAAVYSALLNMLVECFNRRSLIGLVMIFTNPVLFLYNTLIILVTMSIVLLFHAGQAVLEALLMGAAVGGMDIVGSDEFCGALFQKNTIYGNGYLSN